MIRRALFILLMMTIGLPAYAQSVGRSTGHDIPRFVSQKFDKMRVRRGPGADYMIDWEFLRKGMPLFLTKEFGQWRLIQDAEGFGGWVHQSQITGRRTVQVIAATDIRMRAGPNMPAKATFEKNVIADVVECQVDWCKISAQGFRGWAPKSALWGATAAP